MLLAACCAEALEAASVWRGATEVGPGSADGLTQASDTAAGYVGMVHTKNLTLGRQRLSLRALHKDFARACRSKTSTRRK